MNDDFFNRRGIGKVQNIVENCFVAVFARLLHYDESCVKDDVGAILRVTRPTLNQALSGGRKNGVPQPYLKADLFLKFMQMASWFDEFGDRTLTSLQPHVGISDFGKGSASGPIPIGYNEKAIAFIDEKIVKPYLEAKRKNKEPRTWLDSMEAVEERKKLFGAFGKMLKQYTRLTHFNKKAFAAAIFKPEPPATPTITRLFDGVLTINIHYFFESHYYICDQEPAHAA